MIRCRDISDEIWLEARKLLIYYFSRRHGSFKPDDLAHDTLAAFLKKDYPFESDKDFLRVAHAFAKNILLTEWRKDRQMRSVELDPAISVEPENEFGLNEAEMDVLLSQTYNAIAKLSSLDRHAIDQRLSESADRRADNKMDVRFFRAKERLKRLLKGNTGVRNDADPT